MVGPLLGQLSCFGTSTCLEENLLAPMKWDLRAGAFQSEWTEYQE